VVGRLLALAGALAGLAACTSSGSPPSPAPGSTISSTVTVAPSSPPEPSSAPTRAVAAEFCPLVSTDLVHQTMGMRLGRLTVLRSGGRTVGCRFYALQGAYANEHLPGPHQPVVEIATWRYATPIAAHNAFVLAARAGRNPQQTTLGRGGTGVCYRAAFYPKDHGQDFACGASVGPVRVLVRTVDTTSTINTAAVTRAVLRRV